jgi:hypothetical protein
MNYALCIMHYVLCIMHSVTHHISYASTTFIYSEILCFSVSHKITFQYIKYPIMNIFGLFLFIILLLLTYTIFLPHLL